MTLLQSIGEIFEKILGGDVPVQPLAVGQVAARAAVIYVIGVAVIRLGKSRLIGRVTSLDVILGFILGSLLSRGITGHASLSGTFAATASMVAMHWLFTWWACRSHVFGTLVKGHPNLVVEDGRVLTDHMRHSHISINDLEEEMRLQGVDSLSKVKRAYKERNGEVSIIKAE